MKFNTKLPKESVHSGPVTCLSWSNNDEAYSIGDDHQLYKWVAKSLEPIPTAKLPDDFVPTDLHWLTPSNTRLAVAANSVKATVAALSAASTSTTSGSNSGDVLLITSTDGRLVILNRSARVERNVTAHTAAISQARWSPDGAGLLTAGEDGSIKVWSRSGMLRSTVVQHETPAIRCACWSPASDAIAYAQAGFVAVKPLLVTGKLTRWRAHDGMVLCLSWSQDGQLLASGSEDCRYKIWTAGGAIVFASYAEDYAVTSVAFSPSAAGVILLAVGGFNSLRLCDANGFSLGHTKLSAPAVGSVYAIAWSPDGTQIVAGSSAGQVIFGHIVGQTATSRNLIATTSGRRTIELQDIAAKTDDTLDFPDRIVAWRLGYEHLVVATAGGQVHVYHQKYINTPLAVIENRAGVRHIELGKKHFLLVDPQGIWIHTYAGRLHLSPKYAGMQSQVGHLEAASVSMGAHLLAVRDELDKAVIRVFDLLPSANRQPEPAIIHNKTNITFVAATRAGHPNHQYVVFIDTNRDAFCAIDLDPSGNNTTGGSATSVYKIGAQVISCMWGADSNILVGMHDAGYSIWYCPGEACADPTLLALTTVRLDTSEFGKTVQLAGFEEATVRLACNGVTYAVPVNVFCDVVHRLLVDDRWHQALKVCRLSQQPIVWATLAATASRRNQQDICEEAFSAILQVDKVDYLFHLKNIASTPSSTQTAETAIMAGRLHEASNIIAHGEPTDDAINMCVRMHNWESALALAQRHSNAGEMSEMVRMQRADFLKALGRDETLSAFLNASDAN